jgi:phosphatidylglycerol:prolipoprotein diacylglycerol transferase
MVMNISPYIFQSSLVSVRWYGFLIALAVLLSYYLALREIKKEKISENKFDSIFLITVICGIIGGRIAFVIQDLHYFSKHLLEIPAIWDGGLSIHGAIILGSLGLIISCKSYKINFLKLANIISPYLLMSGAIGRWGNFFNHEIIGKPTEHFPKMFVPEFYRPLNNINNAYYHPVFLYESVGLMLMFAIYLLLKKRLNNYAITYTLIAYSAVRIIVEYWRIDYKPIFYHLDLAQIVSFAIIIVTGVLTLTFRRK